MKDFDTRFFRNFEKRINKDLNVMQLCRVVVVNDGQKANVQPLALKSDGTKRALIQNALVLNHCKSDIGVGKTVLVGFCDRDIDNFRGSSDYSLSSERMHSQNDAVILGVFG
ncbi:hypothetical protein CI088_00355 [Enterococcus plantarum]|uniref:Uncharacterized protein n=1 Tax=Enterococcus plantarum TaxID=1077675 RepID=A0A2W4BLX5_9ENTE|nr:hypothetical protein [Enterococcus plantarum]PZL78255.1 hypothetical protein CI088_00355 [Enterococcus plantarum]